MLAKLHTFSLLGIDALPVEVEVDVSPGALPKTVLVGLPEQAAQESTNRIERLVKNMYPRLVLSTLFALLIFEISGAAEPPAMRRWTDKSGAFSTDAVFVEIKQDSVVLRKASGSTVTVPLARLSDADREYLNIFLKPDSKSSKDRASPNLTFPDARTEPPAGNLAPVRWPGIERYPLRPDGTPDFEKYVLNLYREGVTPDNNAAVLLWQVMWPGWPHNSEEMRLLPLLKFNLSEAERSRYERDIENKETEIRTYLVNQFGALYEVLGLPGLPPKQDVLLPVSSFAMTHRLDNWSQGRGVPRYHRRLGQLQREGFTSRLIVEEAQSRLWTSAMIPPLAEWVRENEGPLDQIVAASRRPRYYAPPLGLLDESDQPLEYATFDHHSSAVYRTGIPALAIRAMWHLGEGRSDAARQDILAIHRLARLIGQQDPSLATYAAGEAREATLTMLTEAQLSGAQARDVLQDLSSLSVFSGTSEWLDTVVRATFLDLVLRVKTGRTKVLGREEVSSLADQFGGQNYVFEYPDTAEKAYLDQIHAAARQVRDWDAVLQRCDDYVDRVVAAIRMPAGAARKEALAQIETEWKQRRNDAERQLRSFANLSQQERSNVFASAMMDLLGPHLAFGASLQSHANTTLELTRLAAALAVYRAERGGYPDKLDDLVPGVLATLPVDSYNGNPFVYKRDGEGYFLYSVGGNGVEDGGSSLPTVFEGRQLDEMSAVDAEAARKKIPAGADDEVSLRLPRPAFDWSELLSPK